MCYNVLWGDYPLFYMAIVRNILSSNTLCLSANLLLKCIKMQTTSHITAVESDKYFIERIIRDMVFVVIIRTSLFEMSGLVLLTSIVRLWCYFITYSVSQSFPFIGLAPEVKPERPGFGPKVQNHIDIVNYANDMEHNLTQQCIPFVYKACVNC